MLFHTIYLMRCIKVLCLSRGCPVGQETRTRGNSQNYHVRNRINENYTFIYSDGVTLHIFIPLSCEHIFIMSCQRLNTI